MNDLYLVARVAGQAMAIASDRVGSVVELSDITPVPLVARPVLGLAALRSRVVTVIDTPAAIGLQHSCAAMRRAVVVEAEGHYYALLVDGVDDVVALEAQPLRTGEPLDPAWGAVTVGSVERDGARILIIDPTALLAGLASPAETFR